MIAESIIGAAAELGTLRVPVVVRLQGTNSTEGLRMVSANNWDRIDCADIFMQVEEANLGLYTESEFGEAAKKAVELANTGGSSLSEELERDLEHGNAGS